MGGKAKTKESQKGRRENGARAKGGSFLPQVEEDQEQKSQYTSYTSGGSMGSAQETGSMGARAMEKS